MLTAEAGISVDNFCSANLLILIPDLTAYFKWLIFVPPLVTVASHCTGLINSQQVWHKIYYNHHDLAVLQPRVSWAPHNYCSLVQWGSGSCRL